ncbi:Protein of unknown function [Rhizobium sp. AN5]|uniref:DUF982 domain-containing protein n=1 Tax=Rhizobium sp. AN5 TaxID=1855304 RepID=UPI000BC4D2B8|nr:DUF982 domain-containing protein [Rhizobium sp. AN5]SOC90402.1 Protein of unknown function [Rhizobium sp. AN5]
MTTIPLLGTYPLGLSLGGRCFGVYGVDEAVQLLEEHWPNKTGAHYKQALKSCRIALLRSAPSEVGREHLIAACLEAVFHTTFIPFPEMTSCRSSPKQAVTPMIC